MLSMRIEIAVSIVILGLTALIYAQTHDFEFVNYDDAAYIYDNPQVYDGLTVKTLKWAFTTSYFANWIPLTWISYLIDVSLFDLNAGAFHLENALWHGLNGILLYLGMMLYTKRQALSIFVALLFILHPMHVESVAWISERKDVLSTFFAFGCLLAYHHYAARGGYVAYAIALALYASSLMAKPMLITLPILLLLLDFFPLERWNAATKPKFLFLEKIPFVLLAIADIVLTIWAQSGADAIQDSDTFPITERISNALYSYGIYIWKFLIPYPMLPFYPHPQDSLPLWKPVVAAFVLVAVTAACWRARKVHPAGLLGWSWFIVVLIPVIGLVQVGGQAMADRYTYIAYIGLSILLSAIAATVIKGASKKRTLFAVATILWLLGLTGIATHQTSLWKDSVTLFTHTTEHSPRNIVALTNLGEAYLARGRHDKAIETMQTALAVRPNSVDNMRNLGQAYREVNKLGESRDILRIALSLDENNPDTLNILAMTLSDMGQAKETIALLRKAVIIDKSHADAYSNLGVASLAAGNVRAASLCFIRALQINPRKAQTWSNVGTMFMYMNDFGSALEPLEKSLRLDPDNPLTLVNYAATRFQLGDREDALKYAYQALDIDPEFAPAIEFLIYSVFSHRTL